MCVYMLINVISRECFLLSGYYLLIKKPVDDNYYVSLYFFFFFFFNFGDTFHWLDDNRAFTMQEARAFVSPTGANIDTHSQTNNAWFLALRFFFFFFFFPSRCWDPEKRISCNRIDQFQFQSSHVPWILLNIPINFTLSILISYFASLLLHDTVADNIYMYTDSYR